MILTGKTRVAIQCINGWIAVSGTGSAVTQQNTVCVAITALTTSSFKIGGSREGDKCGEATENVVVTIPYQTVQLQNVILTEKIRAAVVEAWLDSVVTVTNTASAMTALTSNWLST